MKLFSIAEIVWMVIMAVSFGVQLYYYVRYMMGVARWHKKKRLGKIPFTKEQPPVSVIICAHDEDTNLKRFLPSILNQDYPNYEVIVVNDSSQDNTSDVIKLFMNDYAHLRTTFVPVGTRIVSSKKLALNLGIKASTHEHLLFTDADCEAKSKNWISKIMRNYTPGIDIVLGYGAYQEEDSLLSKMISYDTLFIALQYMGMTYSGKPYMAVGRNLSYKKSKFLAEGGFSMSLKYKAGDDDLFVNRIACAENTRIEASEDSITWSPSKKTLKSWFTQKRRHLSVSRQYSTASKVRLTLEPLTRGTFYLSVIGLACTLNWICATIAMSMFLIRHLIMTLIINHGAKRLGTRQFYAVHVLFDIFLPLVNLFMLCFKRKLKQWK